MSIAKMLPEATLKKLAKKEIVASRKAGSLCYPHDKRY